LIWRKKLLKQIHNSFSWYPHPTWYWPNHDESLLKVNNWVRDVDIAFKHIEKFNVVVQAGGACGIWPAYLSNHFKRVVTFEPVKTNIECLKKNIETIGNISFFPCGLSDSEQPLHMCLDDVEKNNCGAFYANKEGNWNSKVPAIALDNLNLKACDFIALDVEGFEGKALIGAKKTIEKFSPVIMVEEKKLPHLRKGEQFEARKYLESIGYKQVEQVHRDVVFKR
jgi:FkbM family methyltransferase